MIINTISNEVTQNRQVSREIMLSPIWVYKVSQDTDEIRAELDSHADTCVVGKPALILRDYERPVKVYGYDRAMGSTTYKTVDAAIGYDCPKSGTMKVIVIHQAIYMPQLDHHLLTPLQMRMNDVIINECPKFLTQEPTDRSHAIVVYDDTREEELLIPLDLRGVTSYFPCAKLSKAQYDNAEVFYSLTYDSPEWDPGVETFALRESTMTDGQGRARQHATLPRVTVAVTGTDDGRQEDLAGSLESNIHLVDSKCGCSYQERNSVRAVSSEVETFSAARLAKNWGIGLQAAKNTIKATTQRGVRTVLHPSLSRRFRTNDRQLRYRRLPIEVFTDTMFAKTRSRRGNKAAQVFMSRNGWKRVFPMENKGLAHEALSLIFARDGVPSTLIVDGSKEQNLGQFKQKARQADCHIRTIEPYSPWANAAESGIRELKRGSQRKMFRPRCPKRLWDDCIEFEAYIQSNTASTSFEARGEVPETIVSGETSDISVWCQHGWYDWVMFRDSAIPYPNDKWVVGRYLGPSLDYSPAMTAKMLKANGQVVHRSTYRDLTAEEAATPAIIAKKEEFTKQVHIKLGPMMDKDDFAQDEVEAITPEYDLYEDDSGEAYKREEVDVVTPEEGDGYINAEVLLPKGGELVSGVVKRRARSDDGELKGLKNDNPILDTRTYEVEFPDGEVSPYTANVIAENMWAQCDIEGNQFRLMSEIVDYEKNGHALTQADMHVVVNGKKHIRKTTTGWKLCVQWKDGSTSWESLSGLKESNPVEVAEYAVAQGIEHEPAFAWWVNHILRKRNRVIASVNKRYFKTTHKYGLRIPKTVKEAQAIDKENGNTLWMDAIAKELADVRIAFDVLADDAAVPVGSQEIRCHLVFDIKMEDFRRKARLVAGGQVTEPPKTITYASVVSRESVRIALTMAALNALEVKASDIQNAYLTAPNQEKIWTVMGPEWGPLAGKRAVIVRALYGLKSAGASFRSHLADCMRTMGYTPCLADPDVWLRPMVRPSDGKKYYAYMLLYVDDCLCMHHDAQHELERLDKYFQMKPGSIGDPNFYLGAKLRPSKLANGVTAWGMSSSKYMKEAVANVETHLRKQSLSLSKRAATPFVADYRPEMDMSKELDPTTANYFQSQIGILRWMVELGRVDIITEVSALASHLALPREGHLEAVYHIFAYLKGKHNATMIFDPTYPDIDESVFQKCDWKEFYGDVTEAIPLNCPEPRGKEVDIRLFVDSSHADDKTNRRSRTGYFIFLNNAPVGWLSRKQATIETSVFGAEFVAMKQGMEAVRGLRYKLRMMGIPISGPTYIYGDNMSVINNTQKPESMLKKKSNSICYHAVRESVAMGESITAHISTNENCADLATKVLPGGRKRDYMVSLLLHDVVDDHEEKKKQPPPTKKVRSTG